jgi:protein-tyrosine phosphatase
MAETMFKQLARQRGLNGVVARSAGLHALPGRPAHEWALAVSRELGMPLDHHRAQPVTAGLISSSDAIFAMDFENLAELKIRFPTSRSKIFLLSAYAEGSQKNREIPDPYFGDIEATRRCYSVLRNCIDKLVRELDCSRENKGNT